MRRRLLPLLGVMSPTEACAGSFLGGCLVGEVSPSRDLAPDCVSELVGLMGESMRWKLSFENASGSGEDSEKLMIADLEHVND